MKRTFHFARIAVSILIILLHIPLLVLALMTNITDTEQGTLSGVSLVLLSVLVLVVASFMTVALWKFTQLVSRMPFKSDLNRCLVFIEILSILGWAVGSFGIGIEFCCHYNDIYSYKYIRSIAIMDLITIDANLINFTIMWLILYKSF